MDKEPIKYAALDFLGSIAIAIGVLEKFGPKPPIHPWLGNPENTTLLIVAGVALVWYGFRGLLPIIIRRAKAANDDQR